MSYTDTDITKVVFNKVTNEQWQEMLQNGELKDDEFYITPDETQEICNNIGQIVKFVCAADWIPEGCLPCNGKDYAKSAYSNFWTNYLLSGALKTCTYTEYEAMVYSYGSCPMFGLDTSAETFKTPTFADYAVIGQANSDDTVCTTALYPSASEAQTSGTSASVAYLRHFVVVAKGIQYNSSINWKELIADVVHLTGDETITGNKTFTGTVTATNTIQGSTLSAYWADLAEKYEADEAYPKGTLVQFGGDKEITVAKTEVNAIVSSEPGMILNGKSNGLEIALTGRVPVRVIGTVKKFDRLTLSEVPGVAKVSDNTSDVIIGRALEENASNDEKLVLCVTRLSL